MLIQCPECLNEVSDKAAFCPKCGFPISQKKYQPRTKRKRLPNGFGQISEIHQNLRKPYRAMVSVGTNINGRPICKILGYYKTYNEAYMALAEYNKDPYNLDGMTVEELYNRWRNSREVGESSARCYSASWKYLTDLYGMPVKSVRTRTLKLCMEQGSASNAPASMKISIKNVLNLMMDYAVEYELTDRNYARQFSYKSPEKQKHHICFSDEEMSAIWSIKDDPNVQMLLVQCYTGLRPKELCSIYKENVHLEENYFIAGMKTEAGTNRIVPIHSLIKPFIERAMQNSSNRVFPCTYDAFRLRLENIKTRLDLNPDHKPHDGRKQFVTMAKAAEVDEYAIKRIVGHKITDLTEQVYTERPVEWLIQEIEKIKGPVGIV